MQPSEPICPFGASVLKSISYGPPTARSTFVLREKNVEMRHRLKALTNNARDNDKLFEKSRQLVLNLLEADSVHALHSAFAHSMATDFEVEHASLILFGEYGDQNGDRRVESADYARGKIGALLKGGKDLKGIEDFSENILPEDSVDGIDDPLDANSVEPASFPEGPILIQ